MTELANSDVVAFTNSRLADNTQTLGMLNAALIVARRKVGWHVSPVHTSETVVIDGPDSRILPLPTRKLNTLTSVAEKGVSITLSRLAYSKGGSPGLSNYAPVRVRKKSGAYWTDEYQGITVVMTHGYTEAEAADWRWAILSMVDQMSLVPVKASHGHSEAGLSKKQIDDVVYTWAEPYMTAAEGVLYSVDSILDDYRLPSLEFL